MTTDSSPQNQLRLVNTQHPMMPNHHADSVDRSFSDSIEPNDPRWLLATRAQMIFNSNNRIPSIGQYDDLIELAMNMGFTNIHAQAIIGIVEDAQFRAGLDHMAMHQLLHIPRPEAAAPNLSSRARWTVFGILFGWSFLIAGLMQLV